MMWSSGGERTEKQMWISLRELNPQMMEHCSFEAIWLMLVCQVHISVLSQYVSRFSRGNLSNLNHQGRNSWELVRLCSSFVWFLQFNHFCVFLLSLFWQRMNYLWVLTLSRLIFPFQSRAVLKTWEHLLSWPLSLLFQRIIESYGVRDLEKLPVWPPGSSRAQ